MPSDGCEGEEKSSRKGLEGIRPLVPKAGPECHSGQPLDGRRLRQVVRTPAPFSDHRKRHQGHRPDAFAELSSVSGPSSDGQADATPDQGAGREQGPARRFVPRRRLPPGCRRRGDAGRHPGFGKNQTGIAKPAPEAGLAFHSQAGDAPSRRRRVNFKGGVSGDSPGGRRNIPRAPSAPFRGAGESRPGKSLRARAAFWCVPRRDTRRVAFYARRRFS